MSTFIHSNIKLLKFLFLTYLFIIQGEGRGHMTQAVSLAQALEDQGHKVAGVLLGTSPQRPVPGFMYEFFGNSLGFFKSPNLILTSDKKGINLALSFAYNILRLPLYLIEILRMSYIIRRSDALLIVNFYDIIGGLAYAISFSAKPYYIISHQHYHAHPDFFRPGKGGIQGILLKFYSFLCAIGARKKIALSFTESMDIPEERLYIVPPLLRRELFTLKTSDGKYILSYLLNPGYLNEIRNWCIENPGEKVVAFTDSISISRDELPNLHLEPLGSKSFLSALAGCDSLICTAGFETVAEAAYLGKKIMLIPAKNHYEQECNAYDALRAGVAGKSAYFDPGLFLRGELPYNHTKLKWWFEKNPGRILSHFSDS